MNKCVNINIIKKLHIYIYDAYFDGVGIFLMFQEH